MHEQTYISLLEDENGKMLDFERWPYKKVSTIVKALKRLYTAYPVLKMSMTKTATTISIYATPDGINREATPVKRVNLSELLEVKA